MPASRKVNHPSLKWGASCSLRGFAIPPLPGAGGADAGGPGRDIPRCIQIGYARTPGSETLHGQAVIGVNPQALHCRLVYAPSITFTGTPAPPGLIFDTSYLPGSPPRDRTGEKKFEYYQFGGVLIKTSPDEMGAPAVRSMKR